MRLLRFPVVVVWFASLSCASSAASSTFQPSGALFKSPVTVASGFRTSVIFSNLTTPRGISFDAKQNLLVVERGFGVTAFTPVSSTSAVTGWERTVVIQNGSFTQGIQVDGSKLYVSTAGATLLYEYDGISRSVSDQNDPISVVVGIPPDGELTTHTLQLERDNDGATVAILIASGPLTNIDVTARDPANGRSQIRRFALPEEPSALPLQWEYGQIIAFGIRNPAGFAFPPSISSGPSSIRPLKERSLVVVENGASIDNATGLTAAFVNDNPADEINLVTYPTANLDRSPAAKSYGFPDCTTLWNGSADPVGDPQFVGKPRGSQFSLQLDPFFDDAFCQNPVNNKRPTLSFQAHSVPLDIKYYTPSSINAPAFPVEFANQAFVSFHGSFDRVPPTGYGVVRIPSPLGPQPQNDLGYMFMVQATNIDTCPRNCIRPVGLGFGNDGRLYVSSDSSGELFVIERLV